MSPNTPFPADAEALVAAPADKLMPLAWLLRSHPETAFDYLEFRLITSGMAARMAAERATEDDRANLSLAHDTLVAAHGKDDPAEEAEADLAFHLAIYKATHNRVLEHIMRSILTMLRDDVFYNRRHLYRREGVRELLLRQHKAIYDAIMARDPEGARVAAEKHIRFTRDSLREAQVAEKRLLVSTRRVGRDPLSAIVDRG